MNRLLHRPLFFCLFGLGCVVLGGCVDPISPQETSSSAVSGSNSQDSSPTNVMAVRVTGMMCPHSCLKEVEGILRKENDIVSLELTPQKQPDVIDNPVVLVTYRGDLKQESTTKAILSAGFEKVDYFVPELKP
jgi:hypothetical protein